jgi:hypothetical protein
MRKVEPREIALLRLARRERHYSPAREAPREQDAALAIDVVKLEITRHARDEPQTAGANEEQDMLSAFRHPKPSRIVYEEGVYVGYRYYETFRTTPAYEFGYGLSYTTFEYGRPALSSDRFGDEITVTVDVKNSGKVAGRENALAKSHEGGFANPHVHLADRADVSREAQLTQQDSVGREGAVSQAAENGGKDSQIDQASLLPRSD